MYRYCAIMKMRFAIIEGEGIRTIFSKEMRSEEVQNQVRERGESKLPEVILG